MNSLNPHSNLCEVATSFRDGEPESEKYEITYPNQQAWK
jgi:hypothetical protein